MSSIRSLVFGERILLLLSHAQSTTTQPNLHVLSSTTFNTLHTANGSSLELAVSLCTVERSTYLIASSSSTLSIEHNIFNGTIYISTTLHLRIKASFHRIGQELE